MRKCIDCPKCNIDRLVHKADGTPTFFVHCFDGDREVEFVIDRNAEQPDWCPLLE